MKNFYTAVVLAAVVFSVLGEWLGDDLGTIAVEVGLNSGSGNPFEFLAVVLLGILIIPFVFVLELSPPLRVAFFALNGACWAGLCWVAWKALKRITLRGRQRNDRV